MKKSKSTLFFKIVVAILFILALFAPGQNRNLILGTLVFGILGTIFLSLLPKFHIPIIPKRNRRFQRKRTVTQEPDEQLCLALLCQLSHRITDKLHAAFPDATWDWELKPDMQRILDGKASRLCLHHAGEFTHAELFMDAYGTLRIRLMHMENLTTHSKGDGTGGNPQPTPVDCSSWYELVGAKVLAGLISDLNARGYSSLSINDNGDIFIIEDGNPVVKDTFKYFPGKQYFEELASIFSENELQAEATEQALVLTWNQ